MRVLDRGHRYLLDHLDGDSKSLLIFVKRIGGNFPGNEPPAYEGVTAQEVLRALIDRMLYIDAQKPHVLNQSVILSFRSALYQLELRAAQMRGDESVFDQELANFGNQEIDQIPVCAKCGHIGCSKHKE